MRGTLAYFLMVLLFSSTALPKASKQAATANAPSPQQSTISATVDRQVTGVEKQVIDAAEAMPEDKFNFSPADLNVAGADFKGVRTFAGQVKHVAASNYLIWSAITDDKLRRA